MAGFYIAESDWPDFAALLRAWRGGELTRHGQPGGGGREPAAQSRLVCLYDNLESGGEARAEVLRRETQHQVQDVCLVGFPDLDEGTVTLRFNGAELPELPADTTADEAFALFQQTALAPYLIAVTLGTIPAAQVQADEDVRLYRWRLTLARNPKTPNTDWPLLDVAAHTLGSAGDVRVQNMPYVGTGRMLNVYSVIPTGDPTPLRFGTQCGCRLFAGVGWGVTEAEMRKIDEFDAPGYDGGGYDG